MTDQAQTGNDVKFARVAARMGRAGWSRHAAHTATLGALQGHGASQAKALAHLADLITEAAARGTDDAVTFAWDADNRGLWVAVPDVLHGGHDEHALTFRADGSPVRSLGMGSGASPAREAFATCVGMTRVTDQRTAQAPAALPPMPAEVTEMLSAARDAIAERDSLPDALASLADLADYVSAQFALSEPHSAG